MNLYNISLSPVKEAVGGYCTYGVIQNNDDPNEVIACMAFQSYADIVSYKSITNARHLYIYKIDHATDLNIGGSTTSGMQVSYQYLVTMHEVPANKKWSFRDDDFMDTFIGEIESRYAFFLADRMVVLEDEDEDKDSDQ